MMPDPTKMFERSIAEQIAINQARSPTQRFQALCDLLDTVRAMAPMDDVAQERRRAAMQDLRDAMQTFADADAARVKFESWIDMPGK